MSPFRFGIVMFRAVVGAPDMGGAQVASAKGARIEAPKALSGVVSEEGCPLASRLGGMGTIVSCPSGAPPEKAFWQFFGQRNTWQTEKCDFCPMQCTKLTYLCEHYAVGWQLWGVSKRKLEEVGLWATGPFIPEGTVHFWGSEWSSS